MFRFSIVCFLIFIGAARAASINEVTEAALRESPALAALEAELDAVRAGREAAGYQPNPELSLELGAKQTDEADGYAAGASLMQTYERGGKRALRRALAEKDVARAELLLDQFKRDFARDVRLMLMDYAIAVADEAGASGLGERCRAIIDLLQERPAAGVSQLLELRLIQASLIEFQGAERDAVASMNSTRAQLNLLMDREPDAAMDVVVEQFDLPNGPVWSTARRQLSAGIELQLLRTDVERSTLEIEAARSATKSDVQAGPFLDVEDADGEESVIGVAVSFTAPLWHRNRGGILVADAKRVASEAAVARAQRELESDLLRELTALDAARLRLGDVTAEALAAIEEAASLADRQYRLGAVSVQLFLDVQREYLNVLQLRSEALREGWRAAAEIERLTGRALEGAR